MAGLSLLLVLLAGALLLGNHLHCNFKRSRRFKKFAQQHGCEPAYDLSGRFPMSLGHDLKLLLKCIRAKQCDNDMLDVFTDIMGDKSTLQACVFGGSISTMTTEPANVRSILSTQFQDFDVGDRRFKQLSPLFGRSVFSSDGRYDTAASLALMDSCGQRLKRGSFWEHSRSLFRPSFHRQNLNDLDNTDLVVDDLLGRIGSVDSAGWTGATKMLPLFYDITMNSLSRFLFGEVVEATRDPASSTCLRTDFTIAGVYIRKRFQFQSFYWLVDGVQFRRAVANMRRLADDFVLKALSTVHAQEGDPKENAICSRGDNLLLALAKRTQDRDELRDQILSMLFAGRNTTAALLSWCFTRLSLHSEVFQDLRASVLQDFGQKREKKLTYSALKNCSKLQNFINEVLRLHPPLPLSFRVANKDVVLPQGGGMEQISPIAVQEGQYVWYSIYHMHRRPDLWGEDALEFKPSRWEKHIPAWQFLPFGGGPRTCLGQQFATTEVAAILVRMLQQFDAARPLHTEDASRMLRGMGIIIWPIDDVLIQLHRA